MHYRNAIIYLLFLWLLSPVAFSLSLIDSWRNGQAGISGLNGVIALVISPDDAFIYSAAFNDDSIGIYQRNDNDGRLNLISQVVDEAGGITSLNGVSALVISADNSFLYALATLDNSITVFQRDKNSGLLQLIQVLSQGDSGISGLNTPASLSLSPDNAQLYISGDGLSVFNRNSGTGQLSVSQYLQNSTAITGIANINAVILSQDGSQLYSVSATEHSIVHFQRASNGQLSFIKAYKDGLDDFSGLRGAYDLSFNRDETQLFVSASIDNNLVVLNHDSSGVLTFNSLLKNSDSLIGIRALLLDPQGDLLFSAANSSGAVSVFNLGASISFKESIKEGTLGISGVLGGASDLVIDSSGRHLYSAALSSDSIALFSTTATDLNISASASPALVALNDDIIVSISINNQGPSEGKAVLLSGSLPLGLSLTNFNASQGSCIAQNSDFSCQLGNIAIGEPIEVQVNIKAQSVGSHNLTLSVGSSDPDTNLSNNSTLVAIQVISSIPKADLSSRISVNADPVVIAGDLSYQINISNLGTDTAENVIIAHTLPSGSGFNRAIASQGSCDSPVNNILRCQLNNMAANTEAEINVTLVAPNLAATLTSSISISSDTIDPDDSNNTASIDSQTEVINADLKVVSLIADKSSINVGETLTYTAVVIQESGNLAKGLNITQQFDPSTAIRFLSASTPYPDAPNQLQPCELQSTGEINCQLGTVDALAHSITVQISVMPISAGNLSNSIAVNANILDSDDTNNQLSVQVSVTGEPIDLAVTLNNSPLAPILNQPLDYLITINNPSSIATAANVILRNTLPEGVTYIGALPDQGSCVEDAGNITCGLGDLSPLATVNIRISVLPITTDDINNRVTISTNSFDDNPLNNAASLIIKAGEAIADLVLDMSQSPDSIGVDETLTYTVSITNKGPNIANNIQLNQIISTDSFYLNSLTPADASCNHVNDTISCQLTQLKIDASVVFTHTISPNQAGKISTRVAVTATETDSNPTDNQFSLNIDVAAPPSLFFVESYKDNNLDIDGLGGATDIHLSQSGEQLYIAAFQEEAIAVYQRDNDTGALSQFQIIRDGVDGVVGLKNPSSLRLSPDQNRLYVNGFGSDSLLVFNRDQQGLLSFAERIQGPAGLAPYGMVTIDNHVYIGSVGVNAIIALTQTAEQLNLLATYINGNEGIDGLAGVNALSVSPDGKKLYSVSITDNALVVFQRDTETGLLTFQQKLTGFTGLQQAGDVIVSADNRYIYTAGANDNSIAIFRQDQQLNYVSSVTLDLLNGVNGLKISPDQKRLYAAASNANALLNFIRDPETGLLSLENSFKNGNTGINGLTGLRAIATSPAGQHIYAAALTANSLNLFRLPAADISLELKATPAQIKAGESVVYTATVNNLGPDGATGVLLNLQLPTDLVLDSSTTEQGQTCQQTGLNISCAIGALASNSSTTLAFNTTPQGQTDYQVQATTSASQADPDNNNNQVIFDSKIVGNANLELNLRSNNDSSILGESLQLQAVITNTGPSDADNIQLTITGTSIVQVSSIDFPDGNCQASSANSLNCNITNLANQTEAILTLGLIPQSQGVATFSAQVSANQNDPSSPNQANFSIEIASNIISSEIDNTGNTLENIIITQTGVVNNGIVSGTISNQGVLNNVTISIGAQVTGGGILSGNIINQGNISNTQLSTNSQITGGILNGNIEGSPIAAANLNNLRLSNTARLTNVVLNQGIIIDQGAILTPSVRFSRNELIPINTDLSALVGRLQDPITGSLALNLSQDLLQNGISLIDAINQLSDIQDSGTTLIQRLDGIAQLSLAGVRFTLLPISLSQASLEVIPGIYPLDEEAVQIVSNQRRVINFTTAINKPSALQASLQAPLIAQVGGNIRVAQTGGYLLLHPQRQSLVTNTALNTIPALQLLPSVAANIDFVQLQHDEQGQIWAQNFGAYPADIDSIKAVVASVDFLANLRIDNQGLLMIDINGQTQQGLLSYRIDSASSQGGLEFIDIADANADGIDDYLIRYPNGDSQILYFLPKQ